MRDVFFVAGVGYDTEAQAFVRFEERMETPTYAVLQWHAGGALRRPEIQTLIEFRWDLPVTEEV